MNNKDTDYVECGLCGTLTIPVNDHGDCLICAKAQYGDE